MPQLPSGRHIALDPAPLAELVTQVGKGNFVHKLMAIKSAEDAFGHIGINYFRPRGEGTGAERLADGSQSPPADLEQYPSGFSLVTIQEELARWSKADRDAFLAFLRAPRTAAFLEGLLAALKREQEELLAHPTTLPGLLATWWHLSIHPLQEEVEASKPHDPPPQHQ